MKAKIEAVTKSKSGKALRVKFSGNDTWYGARLDANLEGAKGKSIEAEVEVDEQYGPQIKKWAFAQGDAAPSSPANGGKDHGSSDKWFMPFVSNTVAHAISSGQITEPSQIGMWAKAAKAAASEL
jgi:hypothetical protein